MNSPIKTLHCGADGRVVGAVLEDGTYLHTADQVTWSHTVNPQVKSSVLINCNNGVACDDPTGFCTDVCRREAGRSPPPLIENPYFRDVAAVLPYIEDLEHVAHDLTGDEGEDDVLTVLRRLADYAGIVVPGKTLMALLEEVEEAIQPGVDAQRVEDMSSRGRLRLTAQEDGDMCILVIEDDGTSAGVEFCASGGRSPHTLQALRNLSRAMQRDSVS
jgi:hypothetical protein